MRQDGENRLPIVEKLAREGPCLLVRAVSLALSEQFEPLRGFAIKRLQIGG